MAQNQDYSVNYVINVEATKGTIQVQKFAEAMIKLSNVRADIAPAIQNIQKMMNSIDKTFRTKAGRKRDFNYQLTVNTKGSEEKLTRVKTLLTEIGTLSKGINVRINAGKSLDANKLKANVKGLQNTRVNTQNEQINKSAAQSVRSMYSAQKEITQSIGKINSALTSLERKRQVNIQTDVAKQRITELIRMMAQLKGAVGRPMRVAPPQMRYPMGGVGGAVAYSNIPIFTLPNKTARKLQEALTVKGALADQKLAFTRATNASKIATQKEIVGAKGQEWERQYRIREQTSSRQLQERERAAALRDQRRHENRLTFGNASAIRQRFNAGNRGGDSIRRAAINRMQYARPISLRSLPFMQMFNMYAAYGFLRSEITKAVEYSNIMTSARSILKVADDDLSTFESRFDKMALYVRQIGVETKFTAMEVAGAVKYLSMAGMDIDTINASIRPITNLALIGDNSVSQIADLATNIMAGYNIKSDSMGSVADVLASTISRSNVNVVEMAESYKMAAGYMRLAGVDFTESSAAIGILGNMGIKGTMAGTALRAMATRFAKPTKESQGILDRLGVNFTHHVDVYGKQVERLRPLADIFKELNDKGATMGDMQAIFGKIGGNAAMMFVRNYQELQGLTVNNRASHGISSELAKVKQDNTKGLWAQMTSQMTESFMKGYELLEPVLKGHLRDLLANFNSDSFAKGIAAIGQTLLKLLSVLADIAVWFTKNYHWIEPIFISGFVATKLFKIAGALTNIGVALGFIGKQSIANKGMGAISSLLGFAGGGSKIPFSSKRQLVTALRGAGVTGTGTMVNALRGGIGSIGAGGVLASQVTTGNGLIGAGASLSAIGTGAVAATAGISALVGALGWVAYRTWKVKEAKDAFLEELTANEKYRYPSIEALNSALHTTYKQALNAKGAIDDLAGEKSISDITGHTAGAFTGNWWNSLLSFIGSGSGGGTAMNPMRVTTTYSFNNSEQQDIRNGIEAIARKDAQSRINAAFADLGKQKTNIQLGAFLANIKNKYGQAVPEQDDKYWSKDPITGYVSYKENTLDIKANDAYKLPDYANYMNAQVVPEIQRFTDLYRSIIESQSVAEGYLEQAGLSFEDLTGNSFAKNSEGKWYQKSIGKGATDEDRTSHLANYQESQDKLVKLTAALRQTWGGSSEIATNIMEAAGFTSALYSNEPAFADKEPFNANGITYQGYKGTDAPDDELAGGNYSGTDKLSSVAPKQVIVNIENLLSVEAIELMQSENGQHPEITDLKEQMAQALIDVVHDFDVSWNA